MRSQAALAVALLSAIVLPASAQKFQADKIAASRDTFSVTVQGQSAGTAVISVAKDNANVRMEMALDLSAMGMQQKDSIMFSPATMSGIVAAQRMSMPMGTFNSQVNVADGRLKGTVARPGPGGVSNVAVDVPYTAGVLPDGAELALIPTLDLADGMTMNFQTFDPSTGETVANALSVKGKENVTIGGAPVEAWKVNVDSKNSSVFYVTTAAPHRIVMIQVPAQMIELKRVSK